MQRRVAPRQPQGGPYTGGLTSPRTTDEYRGGKRKNGGGNPMVTFLIIALFLVVAVVVSVFFPAELKRAEQEAGLLAQKAMEVEHDLAQRAMEVEHDMAERIMGQQQPSPPSSGDDHVSANMEERLAASHAATARMEAQSSRWVDGEKKLKQKLQVLYDRQQQGHDLGVPVLTRWLGDDFPAYVTPDMNIDVAEWKEQVQEKYAEMRKEEEEWQAQMNKIIQQRERDIGITTA